MGIRRIGLSLALGALLAGPALAGDVVSNKFIITDEIFDLERMPGGTIAWRGYDWAYAWGGQFSTNANVVFATGDGLALGGYDAEFGTVRCLSNDYLIAADAAWGLATASKPAILDLSPVLYEAVNFNTGDWRLRPDWLTRLTNFKNRAAGGYNPTTTLFISVYAEVTGSDLTVNEINTAAAKVKQLFPGVKVAAGYPTTAGREVFLPMAFPASLDLIVTWDYDIADPRVAPYSNPASLTDPMTKYGRIINALSASQDIYFLVAGFNDGNYTGSASQIHRGTNIYFGTLLRNWCAFSVKQQQTRNSGLIVWKYNDSYGCVTGACGAGCSGLVRTQTGANKTFSYESSVGSNGLVRAYRAVSRAIQFGESCWAP